MLFSLINVGGAKTSCSNFNLLKVTVKSREINFKKEKARSSKVETGYLT